MQNLEEQVRHLKRRLDLAEPRLWMLEGRFEFVSGLLREIQRHMHNRFEELDRWRAQTDERLDRIDGRLDRVDGRFERIESKVYALPRVLAEMLAVQRNV